MANRWTIAFDLPTILRSSPLSQATVQRAKLQTSGCSMQIMTTEPGLAFAIADPPPDLGYSRPSVYRLSLTPLDKLDEPPSLLKLKDQIDSLLPRVDLPDAILEIHALTGFADEFAHISEGRGRVEDLDLSICAVLVAKACNIGLEPLVRPEIPALTAARLAWVQQTTSEPKL